MSNNQTKFYDIIVIGAGSGGLNVAGFMNRAGFRVLLVDKSDSAIGGDCLNFGCVPSKAFIHAARIVKQGRAAAEFGLSTSGQVDIKAVTDYIKGRQAVIREHENADWFRGLGMDVALGQAFFIGRKEVKVGEEVYRGKKIVIATGSRPRKLDIPGLENARLYNNESIFDIDFLPRNLAVVGGGPIGVELGQAFAMLGSRVSIVHAGDTILNKEIPEVSRLMMRRLEADGVKLYCGSKPREYREGELIIADKNGEDRGVPADAILAAVGRELNVDKLNLSAAGIDSERRRIKLDDHLRTTNPDVFAVGDAAGSYQFTHAAELQAALVLRNFFSPFKKKIDYRHLSWVTYTDPEIATFGLNEEQLKGSGRKYEVLDYDPREADRAIIDDYPESFLRFYHRRGRILGGTMAAPNAGELVQELILANTYGLKLKDFFNKTYAYPVAARVNKAAAAKLMAGKLNAASRKILKILY